MSEDDGLLLNFSTEPVASAAPSKEPKTPYKARTNQKKQRKDAESGTNDKKPYKPRIRSNDLSNKKRKYSESSKRGKSDGEDGKRESDKADDAPLSKRAKNDALDANTFVSSLFSSNAEATTATDADNAEHLQLAPSNAPLSGGDVTFEALGIDPKLSSYLTEKLRFKSPTRIQRLVIPELLRSERDLFIQAQTGSGKTLSFSLPIFHQLMSLSKPVTRESGLFAVILAPSRELALQIYNVLEQLNKRYVRIVPGIVIGGEKKKSEKARLRKGVNILVSTPGRLLDHMNSTKNLHENLSLIRWLVLDEGDKLMELGFEETLTNIIGKIEEAKEMRRNFFENAYPELPKKRINILCSATIKSNVKKLGEISLNNPKLISSGNSSNAGVVEFPDPDGGLGGDSGVDNAVSVPDQLTQEIVIIPPKLRLVSLAGVLKDICRDKTRGSRTIVFLSCADSVEFHFDMFARDGKLILSAKGGARDFTKTKRKQQLLQQEQERKEREKEREEQREEQRIKRYGRGNDRIGRYGRSDDKKREEEEKEKEKDEMVHSAMSAPTLGPNATIYKLHGMLPQHIRTATLNHFAKSSSDQHSILFCTDVVSRGLDLPLISTIIEYDPSFAIDDHLHRVGRTARAGREGRSVLFLLPGLEEKYIEKLEKFHSSGFRILTHEKLLKMNFTRDTTKENAKDGSESDDENAREKKKAKSSNWESEATTWHLNVERWLLEDSGALERAQQAFVSHVRAYATHLSSERDVFNVKNLHLGHLAKSFGLRETPKKLGHKYGSKGGKGDKGSGKDGKKEDPRKKMLRMAAMAVKLQSSEFNFV